MAALDMSSPNMSVNPAAISKSIDDGSVTFQDAGIETPLFQTPRGSAHGELDLMPMSWSRPQPVDPLGSQSPYPSRPSIRAAHLRSLTIPQPPYPASPASTAHSSPEPTDNRRKRKSSADSSESDSPPHRAGGRHPPVKKTAHNMIEKRYRTNLNDKIAALRDSVPSLRATVSKNARGEDSLEDLQGLTPAHKLNKVYPCLLILYFFFCPPRLDNKASHKSCLLTSEPRQLSSQKQPSTSHTWRSAPNNSRKKTKS